MKRPTKSSLAALGLVVALGVGTLGAGTSAFAATSSGSTGNANSTFSTNTGTSMESSNFDQLMGEFFNADSTQAYDAQTGANSSQFNLDTSKDYTGDVNYSKTMTWSVNSGSDSSNSAQQQAAGLGYSNQQATNAMAKARVSSTGSASVTANGHVQTGESVDVATAQVTMPDGSNSSTSSLKTAKTSVINGNTGTSLAWNNSTSNETANNTSNNSSQTDLVIPSWSMNSLTGASPTQG